ncbi:MAG: S-layer homology domain-containing protein [Bacillota bacterium]
MAVKWSGYSTSVLFTVMLSLLASFIPPSASTAEEPKNWSVIDRVSVSNTGSEGNENSYYASISTNGRYVAFSSDASNLVWGDTNNTADVFVFDRLTRRTQRVSVSSKGAQGNGNHLYPSISADGRFVAFVSDSSNLVPGDTNGMADVFVHDRQLHRTERVSISGTGMQANGNSYFPSISADGRYVAFSSDASNLVSGDTNRKADVFVHDRWTRRTERVSVSSTGAQGEGDHLFSCISADGRFVAFASDSDNLVNGDTNGTVDIFVHDRQTRRTERVSVSSKGVEGDGEHLSPSISADGRYVAFVSNSKNLVEGDTNDIADVFVRDREKGRTERVSVSTTGRGGDKDSRSPSINADGRYVAFISDAANLTPGDTNARADVFIYDRKTEGIQRVSDSRKGAQGNADPAFPCISADGSCVAFVSGADSLVPGDLNYVSDVFVSSTLPFKDISGHWAARALEELAGKAVVGGYPDGSFKPDNKITRAEAVGILARVMKLAPGSEKELSFFKDKRNIPAWAQGAVAAAVKEGLVEGYPLPDGTVVFNPNATVSRAELAVLISRILVKKTGEVTPAVITFRDAHKIPAWAGDAVGMAYAKGIIAGYPDNTFRPQKYVTRAEAGAMILRLLKQISGG